MLITSCGYKAFILRKTHNSLKLATKLHNKVAMKNPWAGHLQNRPGAPPKGKFKLSDNLTDVVL
jgi:hypothetical protein